MPLIYLILFIASSLTMIGCQTKPHSLTKSGLNAENFEAVIDGKNVALYTLTNDNGCEACITNYGGRLVSLMMPDKNGRFIDVVLGHDSINHYMSIDDNFGALIGRYGNRINHGRFKIDDIEYQLPQNNFGHCLHGGPKGFHHSVWDVDQANDSSLCLSLFSPDGEAGFPGNVKVKVTYTLTHDNALDIAYEATTDKATIINLTNHSYFNLSGDPGKDILSETVWFDADKFTPIDSSFMTTGEIAPVCHSPFDFNKPKAIGKDIYANDKNLINGRGYDHNMVLNKSRNNSLPAAYISDHDTGIKMEVYTTEPGIQFYTGNFLDGTSIGKKGIPYPHRSAVCLETQHYPDSPNKPQWESVVIRPGEIYHSNCKYKFITIQ